MGLGALSALAFSLQIADVDFNWDNIAYWEEGNYEEMWALHDALVAEAKAVFTESVESDEGEISDAEEASPSTESAIAKGLQRDLENNTTGHPSGTPINLPSPGASQEEIQEALGPDWSPPANPQANWTNKNSGEWLRPDNTTHEGDPHWDYNYRGSQTKGWRLRPEQMPELKK